MKMSLAKPFTPPATILIMSIAPAMIVEAQQIQSPLMVPGARYSMSLEEPISVRAEGFDYDHWVQVALPATYGVQPEKKYPVLLAETLHLRQYPSIEVTTRIYSGRNHLTVVPDILSEGIQTLWADAVKDLPKMMGD